MMTRTLLQADDARCENEFNRVTDDGSETPCCFPVRHTVTDELVYDCFTGTDDEQYCATELNGSVVRCKSNGGVQDIGSSSSEADTDSSSEDSGNPAANEGIAQLQDAFFAPESAPSVERFTINDLPCKFPATSPNGEEVSDCFEMQEEYTAFDLDENTQREYCYEEGNDGEPVQCAARGYIPGQEMTKPEGLCPDVSTVTTMGGKTCTFPQINTRTKNWECGCYSIHNDADAASYDDEVEYSCQPDGNPDGRTEPCPAGSPTSSGSTVGQATGEDATVGSDDEDGSSDDQADSESEEEDSESEEGSEDSGSSDGGEEKTEVAGSSEVQQEPWGDGESSDNTLAIALGVGIPLGLITVGALAGGAFWFLKKRPEAKAAKFNKFEGDNPIRGGAVSSKDVQKTGEGLSAVSKFAEV